jgi:hypothetical protein
MLFRGYLKLSANSRFYPIIKITKNFSPMFFVYRTDDHIPVHGGVQSLLGLNKTSVLGRELHIYMFKGYGQGLNSIKSLFLELTGRAISWLQSLPFFKSE